MKLYSVRMGPNWALVEAWNADAARAQLAERLKVANRPWVVRSWEVREATAEDVKRYGAQVDALKGRSKTSKPKPKREPTVRVLKRKHPSLFDVPDDAA